MKSSVEPLEGNQVKVTVTVDEDELEPSIDQVFSRLSREVRLPGFRPGKVPRKVLEARIGKQGVRADALQEALPQFYADAVIEHNVDVIDAPEFDITEGAEEGPVSFDAVVEVRPQVTISGYTDIRVEVPRPTPTDDEIQAQIDRLRDNFAELNEVDRPAVDGDHVTIDITGSIEDEDTDAVDATDYLYEVGSGTLVPELDEALRGAKPGDILQFDADHPDPERGSIAFRVLVKDVKEKVLPDETDEWAAEASEFETMAELRADVTERLSTSRRNHAAQALRQKTAEAVAELVDPESVPEAMVRAEMREALENLQSQLSQQGLSFEQFMAISGTDQEALREQLEEQGSLTARVDLALRAVATAEGIEPSEDDVEDEVAHLAYHLDEETDVVRDRLERGHQIEAIRSDIRKRQALDWLIDQIEIVDEEGNPVDRALLEIPDDHAHHRPGADDHAAEDAAQDDNDDNDDNADKDAEETE